MRESRCVWHAVVIVGDRKDARAVAMTDVGDDFVCPRIGAADREARRPVPGHSNPAGLLEHVSRMHEIGTELLGRLIARSLVRVSVAGELVSSVDDPSHGPRVACGDPAQREEGRVHARFVEHGKKEIDIALNSARKLVPTRRVDVRCEGRHLEPVLDVDRKGVDDGQLRYLRRNSSRRAAGT